MQMLAYDYIGTVHLALNVDPVLPKSKHMPSILGSGLSMALKAGKKDSGQIRI